jgi:hypothetical protein
MTKRLRGIHGYTAIVDAVPRPLRETAKVGRDIATAALSAAAATQVAYHNGALLSNVEVVAVFLGAQWQAVPFSAALTEISNFCRNFVTSAAVAQLSEYGVPAWPIEPGSYKGSVVLSTPTIGSAIDDAAIQEVLTEAIAAGRLLRQTANSLYVAFLPDQTTVTAPGIGASCNGHCGYHSAINDVVYAVIPYPSCDGCRPTTPQLWAVFDCLTTTTSHEICEAITNPFGTGWYIDDGIETEIGDVCAWKPKAVGAYTVQQVWSNRAGACK